MSRLTKRTVDALATRANRYDVYDSEVPGLRVRVMPSGDKVFGFLYRAGNGRKAPRRALTLGAHGEVTAAEARQWALQLRATIAKGGDPGRDRDTAKDAPTVAAFGTDYLAEVDAKRKRTTGKEYRRQWEKHVLPALSTLRVSDVTTSDVSRLHRSLRATPYLANRVLATLGAFFQYAERQAVRPRHTNPAHEVEPYAEHSRERFLKPDEIVALGDALTHAENEGLPAAPTRRRIRKTGSTAKHRPKTVDTLKPANPFAVAAIRFLLLTGWREQEALTLRWDWLDLSRGVAHLPDTKVGKSVRVIGAPACLLVSGLPRVEGSPYVFPGRELGRPLVEINRVWFAARYAAGLPEVRLHDLRHTFASINASAGASLLMIGKLLGHRETATTAKYAHLLEDPVRHIANSSASQLADWLKITPSHLLRIAD